MQGWTTGEDDPVEQHTEKDMRAPRYLCVGPRDVRNEVYLKAYPALERGTVDSYTWKPLPDVILKALEDAPEGGLVTAKHEVTNMAHYKVEIEVPAEWQQGTQGTRTSSHMELEFVEFDTLYHVLALVESDAYLLSDVARTPYSNEVEIRRLQQLRELHERREISNVCREPYNALSGFEGHRAVAPPPYRHEQVQECFEHSPHLFDGKPPPGEKATVQNCSMKPSVTLPRPSETFDPKTTDGISKAMDSQWNWTHRPPPPGRRAVVNPGAAAMEVEDEDGAVSDSTSAGKPHSHLMVCDEAVFSSLNGLRTRWIEDVLKGRRPCKPGEEQEATDAALRGLSWAMATVVIVECEPPPPYPLSYPLPHTHSLTPSPTPTLVSAHNRKNFTVNTRPNHHQ